VTRYDAIGTTYTETRRADPQIAAAIWDALGDARSVANVGAGTGSYEPEDRDVVAIEPSETMIARRPLGAAAVYQGTSEALPLDDASVDAAMAIWTIHHWRDVPTGLAELRRVARRRVVVVTWDKTFAGRFWLTSEYVPELENWSVENYPAIDAIAAALGRLEARILPIPRDCRDGFLRSFWARPERYLDDQVRKNISQFNLIEPAAVARGMERLADDLASGAWDSRHGELRTLDALDLGYRILIAPARDTT
jgi:ubiquinone/menaquinone biosynthesis C-methylase UbiE